MLNDNNVVANTYQQPKTKHQISLPPLWETIWRLVAFMMNLTHSPQSTIHHFRHDRHDDERMF